MGTPLGPNTYMDPLGKKSSFEALGVGGVCGGSGMGGLEGGYPKPEPLVGKGASVKSTCLGLLLAASNMFFSAREWPAKQRRAWV